MFSRMLYVRQHFPDRRLKDIPGEVQKQLSSSGFGANLKPGARIAIGVGSRGISNIATIVRSVVDFWKSQGFQPFIFPAMGSHGAATAEGQADVLAHLGVHEATMGCPVISQLEVVSVGTTEDGLEAFLDKQAYDSDGVFLIGRVKWHTDFAGKLESGLFKMMAIGLGKFAGAQRYHTWAFNIGMEKVIRNVGRQMIKSGKILGGLAILEDGNHNTAQLTAVPVDVMEQREEELLVQVKSWMGRLPFDLDILMIDEVGKTFSGAGMDCKVVNRSVHGEYNPWDTAPKFVRVFLRGLSDHSYGNGVGVGMADIIHSRYLKKVDWTPTRINSLTSSTPPAVRIPIYYDSDKECLEVIAKTVGKFDMSDIRIGWIGNSLEIGHMALSATFRSEIEKRPELEILGDEWDLPYDEEGNLQNILLHEKLRQLTGYEVSAAH
ncbi:hypothetical protein F183_A39240 [Bryobacterales bacterium F-183]|nr:hypothetical protein F183_A39240 [Bryobacterales bacterium F-183]